MSLAGLRLRRQLEEQAVRDSLTGLYNRRFLEESLRRECHRAARAQGTLALILLDVDRLKGFNDGFGHAAGDAVLRACADAMTGCTRAEDAVCRVGGDEFVVMMPGASAADAVAKSEEIRVAIGGLTVLDAGRPVGPVTISGGVATFPVDAEDPDGLLWVADTALYRAKAAGRDRIEAAPDSGPG